MATQCVYRPFMGWAAAFTRRGSVTRSWKGLLRETAQVIGEKGPVWAFLDNAYYRKEVVAYLKALGWDFSII